MRWLRWMTLGGAGLLAVLAVVTASAASTVVRPTNAGRQGVAFQAPCTVAGSVYGRVYGSGTVAGSVYGGPAPVTTLSNFRDVLFGELLKLDPAGCDPLRARLLHLDTWLGSGAPSPSPSAHGAPVPTGVPPAGVPPAGVPAGPAGRSASGSVVPPASTSPPAGSVDGWGSRAVTPSWLPGGGSPGTGPSWTGGGSPGSGSSGPAGGGAKP